MIVSTALKHIAARVHTDMMLNMALNSRTVAKMFICNTIDTFRTIIIVRDITSAQSVIKAVFLVHMIVQSVHTAAAAAVTALMIVQLVHTAALTIAQSVITRVALALTIVQSVNTRVALALTIVQSVITAVALALTIVQSILIVVVTELAEVIHHSTHLNQDTIGNIEGRLRDTSAIEFVSQYI